MHQCGNVTADFGFKNLRHSFIQYVKASRCRFKSLYDISYCHLSIYYDNVWYDMIWQCSVSWLHCYSGMWYNYITCNTFSNTCPVTLFTLQPSSSTSPSSAEAWPFPQQSTSVPPHPPPEWLSPSWKGLLTGLVTLTIRLCLSMNPEAPAVSSAHRCL